MAYVSPKYSKNDVNHAGKILCYDVAEYEPWVWAYDVLANWRACHGYPINTFQALLRKKLKEIDKAAIVAQRLKRAPSVIAKLKRFNSMKLSQMQDIGGLRAVVSSIYRVRRLEKEYRSNSFHHELVSSKDYIENPKPDGYRSIHLVYRYKSKIAPEYCGLLLEMQFRTRLQHAWATAVETMGTFLGKALKSGEGDDSWKNFFKVSSAAICHSERTPVVPGYEKLSKEETYFKVADLENELHVIRKLKGFSIAADSISEERGTGSYHLVVLDSENRSVSIKPYPKAQLEQANIDYAIIEERAQKGEQIEAVLVSAGPIEALKKAYPNYFLDTHIFVSHISTILQNNRYY